MFHKIAKVGIRKQVDFSSEIVDELLKENEFKFILKRSFDILISLLGLLLLSPVFLIISILIKLDSRGPVFFRQIRIGKDVKEFKIFKFRTMIVDSEKKGMQITVDGDKRITRSGDFLRKSKMDELPQLINVLIGDMSFVGPRPEVPKYVKMYDENQKNILKIRPGITDIASIEYRDENLLLAQSNNPEKTYIEDIMPKKIQLNIEYIKDISLFNDFKLIIKTIFKIIL